MQLTKIETGYLVMVEAKWNAEKCSFEGEAKRYAFANWTEVLDWLKNNEVN